MNTRQEILSIPEALRATLTGGRPEFEALIRQTRLGHGPIFMVGCGSSYLVGLTGVYAFEGLLGRPVIARPALDFRAYSASTLATGSVVFVVSHSGESAGTIEAARAAHSRGAMVLALTGSTANSLAKLADGVFQVRAGEECGPRMKTVVCQQAALGYISVLAARILKRPQREVEALEQEFEKLPGQVEWVLTQLQDAARSLALRLKELGSLGVAGGGFYCPTALQWALLVKKVSRMRVDGFEPSTFADSFERLDPPAALVVASGSGCRLKKEVHRLAARWRKTRLQVFSVTDANDRELVDQSSLAVLLPLTSEVVGSTLTLALLDWVAYEISGQ